MWYKKPYQNGWYWLFKGGLIERLEVVEVFDTCVRREGMVYLVSDLVRGFNRWMKIEEPIPPQLGE